jgi:CRISPR-associated endonuclease/helicase Cas3
LSEAIAHVSPDGTRIQTVEDHLRGVAELAARFVEPFCPGAWGEIAGRWHDLGKYSPEFQAKIRAETGFDEFAEAEPSAGRVDHSTAGAVLAYEILGGKVGYALATDAIAAVVAGHHAGLSDLFGALDQRIRAKAHFLARAKLGSPPPELLLATLPEAPRCVRIGVPRDETVRDWELWVRMLFSAVVDADSLDTEAFCDPQRSAERGLFPLVSELGARLEDHLHHLCGAPGAGAPARQRVQEAVRAAASRPPGVFTLTVPTGGGKTLASLLFGLRHAAAHGLGRVIVVPPYTSIIEQTADVYRRAIGVDSVVEHHGALDPRRDTRRSALATENWDAPVVVTTAVQFIESLFANRRSRCRKLHNVARSVVVLDEAQTLPPDLLAPILDVLKALVRGYGVSLVLCTATMPALRRRQHFPHGFEAPVELAPEPEALADALRRVEVTWPASMDSSEPWDTLAQRVTAEPRVLAVVHRKADARLLTELLDRATGNSATRHLSGNMCPEHRATVLGEVRSALKQGEPIRVVATQLIEAGVDVDFPVVFRALAGLDSLTQAAGRCNREGRAASGRLEVFVPPTRPPRGAPAAGESVARGMLAADPDLDLFSPAVHESFFRQLYASATLDGHGVQALRAERKFEQVAQAFRLIEDGATEVVVPWGRGAELLSELERLGPDRRRLRALQRFVVRVPGSVFQELGGAGALEEVGGALTALRSTFSNLYTERFGLVVGAAPAADPEAFVV